MRLRNLVSMYFGALCGTAMWLSPHIAFVQSLPLDAELRHMAPERFFYFMPFFAFWALGIGLIAETVAFLPRCRPLRSGFAWVALGLAYSLVWVFYAIRVRSPWMLAASYVIALAAAAVVHILFAERGSGSQ